jgi:hypothetical protein
VCCSSCLPRGIPSADPSRVLKLCVCLSFVCACVCACVCVCVCASDVEWCAWFSVCGESAGLHALLLKVLASRHRCRGWIWFWSGLLSPGHALSFGAFFRCVCPKNCHHITCPPAAGVLLDTDTARGCARLGRAPSSRSVHGHLLMLLMYFAVFRVTRRLSIGVKR